MNNAFQDILNKSKTAALIPTLPDSRKEEKITSILLSVFKIVPKLATSVLEGSNLPTVKAPKIESYIEVALEADKNNPSTKQNSRPDGVIIVSYKGKKWTAFVESKVGNNELQEEQITRYLELAKQYEIDAVITFSNQFAPTPSHHPLNLSKSKLKGIGLYHYSWLSILAKSMELIEKSHVDDPEQAIILEELIRYMDSKESNVAAEFRMSSHWGEAIEKIQKNISLLKTDIDVLESVASWHQLQRYLALQLSRRLNEPVKQYLSRSRAKDISIHLKEDIDDLITSQILKSEFDIPNAAARLCVKADLAKRNITLSMLLNAPEDKKQASASINWLTRQIKDTKDKSISICVYWPKRIAPTHLSLDLAVEDPKLLIPSNTKETPTYLEPYKVIDLAGKFSTPKKFVEIITKETSDFYENIGQLINKWIPKPPKIKKSSSNNEEESAGKLDIEINESNSEKQENTNSVFNINT